MKYDRIKLLSKELKWLNNQIKTRVTDFLLLQNLVIAWGLLPSIGYFYYFSKDSILLWMESIATVQ